MKLTLSIVLFSHLSDAPLHAELNPEQCGKSLGFVAHLLHKYFDGASSTMARAKEVADMISSDWRDLDVEDLAGYCEEIKHNIGTSLRQTAIDPDAEYAEFLASISQGPEDTGKNEILGDPEIDELLVSGKLTIERVIDRVIQLNGIIGVGLISLADHVNGYIRQHAGYNHIK